MAMLRPGMEQAILEILAARWPLRVNDIVQSLQKRGHQISYANARKKIFRLAHEGVLKRSEDGFALSIDWALQSRAFAQRVLENYEGRPTPESIDGVESTAEFWFGSVSDLDKFFIHFTDVHVRKSSDDTPICWQIRHSWWPLFYSQAEHEAAGGLNRFYILCSSNTSVDSWCWSLQRKLGYNVNHGPNVSNCDTGIFDDLIFQIHLPADFLEELEKLFNVQSIDKLDMGALIELMRQPRKIRVLVMRNPELANVLRAGIMKHFKAIGQPQSLNRAFR